MGKVVPEWRPLVERIIKAFEDYVHEDDPDWEAPDFLWQEVVNIVSAWFKKPPDEQALWARCDECDWGPYRYETAGQARTALASHKRKHR